jgi:hypothetical protein
MLILRRKSSVQKIVEVQDEKEIFELSLVLSLIWKIQDLHMPKYDVFIGLKFSNVLFFLTSSNVHQNTNSLSSSNLKILYENKACILLPL